MKKYRQHFVYALTLWLLVAQMFALGHALEHELAGHQEACSICLDAAHFSNADIVPEQITTGPPLVEESTLSFETAFYTGLDVTHYSSRAPPRA